MQKTKLLTPDEVSNLLGVKKHTLAVWRSSGRYNLPFIKAGRLVRYRQSDLDLFLENQSCSSTGDFAMGAEIS
ncbi:MAG: helix-turn-helix domain-containing protein [Gammaproteobacteria bacterium]|nr:helix-turn-helix domain-containing protein [Gammaproteobacteria bacterium]